MTWKSITAIFVLGTVVIGVAPEASAQRPYANWTEAQKDGRYNIPKSDPAYWSGGDRDHDGFACDS